MHGHGHGGERRPYKFDVARAERLDRPERLEWLPPPQLAALLDIPLNASVLDYGTGTGALVIPIAKSRLDATFYALDEQPGMLELLHAKLDAQLLSNVVPLEPQHAGSLAGRLDRILAVNVLHELEARDLALMHALLRPGGFAVIVDWNPEVERPAGPPPETLDTAEEARARLGAAGFAARPVGTFRYHHACVARPTEGSP